MNGMIDCHGVNLDRNRRERDFLLSGTPAPRILFDVGHGKEWVSDRPAARGLSGVRSLYRLTSAQTVRYTVVKRGK
jgi:hypothetical protein